MRINRWPAGLKLALAALALCVAPAWIAGQQPAPVEPAQKLEQLKKSYEDKQTELGKKYSETKDDAERRKLYEGFQAFVKQAVNDARSIAESVAGTETAAEAWSFVLRNAQGEAIGSRALDILVEKHLTSPAWKEIAPMFGYLSQMSIDVNKVDKALRALMEKSPHKGVQAGAMYALGATLMEDEDCTKHDQGVALLVRVQKDFAEVKEAKDFVQRAEGTLFQLERLQPFMPCPDFEATDETGAKFKLSDYKGKVVLIDFWGYW